MSNNAHFFNLNDLLKSPQQAWVVDKDNPNVPLMKISSDNVRLLRSGIYAKKGNRIEYNDVTFYLPDELANKLKVISSKRKINYTNLVISLQEFMNGSIIKNIEFEFNLEPIMSLKNKMDDIYIVSSLQVESSYKKTIEYLEETLRKQGIIIKKFYYLNENFMNQDSDENLFKTMRLLLQHSIGYKTEDQKFIDEELISYENIYYYDNNLNIFSMLSNIPHLLKYLVQNTEAGLRDVIKEIIQESDKYVFINQLQDNDHNTIKTKKVKLDIPKFAKTFESFVKFNLYFL
jgi:hypothetical protein